MRKKTKHASQSQVNAHQAKSNQSTPKSQINQRGVSPNESTTPRSHSSTSSPLAAESPQTTSLSASFSLEKNLQNAQIRLVKYDEFSLLHGQVQELVKKFECSILNHKEKVNPVEFNGKTKKSL